MNINDLTVGQVKEISAMFASSAKAPDMLSIYIGHKVVIRDDQAGMVLTTLTGIDGLEWTGAESRKIHWWEKAGAIEGIAETGIDLKKSLITVTTPVSNGKHFVQLCPVKDEIYNQIMEATPWNPK